MNNIDKNDIPSVSKSIDKNNKNENIEVHKIKEWTYSIWDLHWNYEAFINTITTLWLVRKLNDELIWNWWKSKLIFLGDILWDRFNQWDTILDSIANLKKQAKMQWWDISVIAWNHDNAAFWFLGWSFKLCSNWKTIRPSQMIGVLDYYNRYYSKDFIDFSDPSSIDSKDQQLGVLLRNGNRWFDIWDALMQMNCTKITLFKLRTSNWFEKIVENISNFTLIKRVDDTIYCHTPITKSMRELLVKHNLDIEKINNIFQTDIREILLWIKNDYSPEVRELVDTFLNTNNRSSSQNLWILKPYWINKIIHWHNWKWKQPEENVDWIICKDIDAGFWHPNVWTDWKMSIWFKSKDWNDTFLENPNWFMWIDNAIEPKVFPNWLSSDFRVSFETKKDLLSFLLQLKVWDVITLLSDKWDIIKIIKSEDWLKINRNDKDPFIDIAKDKFEIHNPNYVVEIYKRQYYNIDLLNKFEAKLKHLDNILKN